MAETRLQKFLAAAGLCSRRGAEELMRQGRVLVDGKPALDMGRKIDPLTMIVTVDGRVISETEELGYYMFHKPAGFLTSLGDPYGRPTILPFLQVIPIRVYPVGRLDMDVSGLLILTNDGELSKRLMHPSSMIPKVYRALVRGIPTEAELQTIRSGTLIIDDKPAAPAKAHMVSSGQDSGWLELTLTEGRHRQVKRMCSAIGHSVVKLKRIAYCGLKIPLNLEAGEITALTERQIDQLKEAVGL